MAHNPCERCGACCASFRVSFYWAEGAQAEGGVAGGSNASAGGVPATLTQPLPPHRLCMAGTNSRAPRCIALVGEVGAAVSCAIYAQRSSTCREFAADGSADSACTRARAKNGLAPLAEALALT